LNLTTSMTSKFGAGAITRSSSGETITTSKFGDGTISRSSIGSMEWISDMLKMKTAANARQ